MKNVIVTMLFFVGIALTQVSAQSAPCPLNPNCCIKTCNKADTGANKDAASTKVCTPEEMKKCTPEEIKKCMEQGTANATNNSDKKTVAVKQEKAIAASSKL
jgi:hypothetical protein